MPMRPLRLPSGNFPYHSEDGSELFILSGSESGKPDLGQVPRQQESDDVVVCDLCARGVKTDEMRHHTSAHVFFDESWLAETRPAFPCGYCGTRSAVPFTSAATMVAGCPTGLVKGRGGSYKPTGTCKLIGTPKYAHKAALTSTTSGPSTNVPLKCPKCPDRPGVFVFKYSMPKHYALEHRSHTMPPEFAVSDQEKAFLKSLWLKIQKKR
jgi:hypothetical protein